MELKEGAQVMFIKNNQKKGYFNGKIGKIAKFNKDSIIVEVTNGYDETVPIVVEPFIWENILYTWNEKEKRIEEKVTGTFTQYPLKLAWAITVHKSQGMTFEKVIADVGSSFAAGQVYVALSRCTSMNGLILKSKITPQAIKTDSRVIKFAENEVPETLILEELQKGKADYYYAESRKELKSGNAEGIYDNLIKAIKYRNDLQTDLFKRYFCALLNRFYHNAENSKILQKKLFELRDDFLNLSDEKETLEKDNLGLRDTIQKLNYKIFIFDISLSENKEKIETKDGIIQSLNKKLDLFQKKNDSLNLEIMSLSQKEESLKSEIDKLKKEKKVLEDKNSNLIIEINRVNNIKWYQKLFGKK